MEKKKQPEVEKKRSNESSDEEFGVCVCVICKVIV